MISEWRVVCLPRPIFLLMVPVSIPACGESLLISDDLPTPLGPATVVVFPCRSARISSTPSFSSAEITKEELGQYYPEFVQYEPYCRFSGCAHMSEPSCGVKEAVEDGRISRVRYENYRVLYQELKDIKRYD